MTTSIQIKAGTANGFYSTSVPTNSVITSIKITSKTNSVNLYVSKDGSNWGSATNISSTTTKSYTTADGYKYFKVMATSKYAQITSIVITYESGSTSTTDYSVQWMVNGQEWKTTQVTEGEKVVLPTPDPTSCSDTYKNFVGWFTDAAGSESKPSATLPSTQVTAATELTGDATYYAVFSAAGWELVTSTSELVAGGTYTIASSTANNGKALGTQNDNNRAAVDWGSATELTLGGNATDGWTFYDATGSGYLFAASSEKNYLKTQTTLDDNGKWTITIATSGSAATIKAKGTNTRNLLKYNSNSTLFSCYSSGQSDVYLFKKSSGATGYISSCCTDAAVVTVKPDNATINLNELSEATTGVTCEQTNGTGSGTWNYSVSPSDGAPSNGASISEDGKTFTATQAGTYTVTATYKETCDKSASATITVLAKPIVTLTATELNFDASCDETSEAKTVIVKGYYLTDDVTVSVTDGANIAISSNGTDFGTSATVTQDAAAAGKEISVRVTPPADSTTPINGKITAASSGAEDKTCNVKATVTCGTSIRLTATDAESTRITAVNGQWTRTHTPIKIKGSYLTNDASAVTLTLTSSNANFKFVDSQTTGAGSAEWKLTNITSLDTAIYIVYTPTDYDQRETATITAKITTYNSSYEHATGTIEVYGRSLPKTFVLALNTGSQWVALPADMIAPFGGGINDCTTGVGTHDPYPITVDNAADPKKSTSAPARAIYKGAARNTPTTNPWTSQFESNTQAGYYLFGSVDGSQATYIGNVTYEESDRVKWALMSNDLVTYRLHQYKAVDNRNLGYNGTSGNNAMGQYTNTATGYKYDFRILPVDATCTYYIKPVMTYSAYDATNSVISIPYDGTTEYEYSTDEKNTWKAVTGTIDCKTLNLEFDNAKVEGKALWLRPQGSLCSDATSETAIHMLKPNITASNQTFTATSGVAFSGKFGITLTDIWTGAGGGVTVTSDNDAIRASISGATVTVGMDAAAAGTYTAQLTFKSVGATDVTITVKITVQDLAPLKLYLDYDIDGVVCQEEIKVSNPIITWDLGHNDANANLLYKGGTKVTATNVISNCVALYDVTEGKTPLSGLTSSISSVPQVYIDVTASNMQLGHTYRFEFTNNEGLTTEGGLRYADAAMEFKYIRCDIPTALPACPITSDGFTANWVTPTTGCYTLDVYTKQAGASLVSEDWSTKDATYNKITTTSADLSSNLDKLAFYSSGSTYYTSQQKATTEPYGIIVSNDSKSSILFTPQFTATTPLTFKMQVYQTDNSTAGRIDIKEITPKEGTNEGTLVQWVSLNTIKPQTDGSILTYETTVTPTAVGNRLHISFSANKIRLVTISLSAEGTKTSVPGYPKEVCGTEQAVSGLPSGTQYYYTVSDGSNTSNEVAVTTRTAGDKTTLAFGQGALSLSAESVCVTESVSLNGTNIPACSLSDLTLSIAGTDAAKFTYDASHVGINTQTGVLSGNLQVTYCPGNELGNHSATLTATVDTFKVTLPLHGTNCPANFGTMATDATDITATTATANWTQSTTGYLMLSENAKVNTNLLLNPGFESGDLTGWGKSVADSQTPTITKDADGRKTGSYGVYIPESNVGKTALQVSSTKYGGVYANQVTLSPGTYTMTAWVRGATKDSTTTYLDGSFYLGLYNSGVVAKTAVVSSSNNKDWQQISGTFTIVQTVTAYPFVAHSNGKGAYFLDDVSLVCTAGQANNNYKEYSIDNATSLGLSGLKPNTSYSYYIVNANGCESNVITFNTSDDASVVVNVSAAAVSVVGPVGETTYGTFLIKAENAYADILLTNSCGTSPIKLLAAKVSQDGGVVQFAFTPTSAMTPGATGTCTISMITTGMTTPATMNITWTVAAGTDPNAPLIEVVDISTSTMSIDHNVAGDGTVRIVLNRELTEEEKTENVGDEIFFSKYYEAYMHKKLWAIYNPTNDTISLAGTEVWRSSENGVWYSGEDKRFDLSGKGRIKPGYICPNEEIIIYTADQVGTCEQSKADMSEWTAGSSTNQPLAFSGNDALVLVRNTASNSRKVTESSVDGSPITWRIYDDTGNNDRGTWLMLDLIGARKADNTPDLSSASSTWSWTNYNQTPNVTEKGDANGWWRHDGFSIDGTTYKEGGDQTPVINNGYLLSTNRCLLIRRQTVKSGAAAVQTNVGNMFTLGGAQCEWRGKHVPTGGDQNQVSCDNFAFVGGYDYDNYYNSWTPIDDGNYTIEGTRNAVTGDYDITEFDNQQYKCHDIRIEVVETVTVDGVDVDNIKAYTDYRVPIVVEGTKTTDDAIFQSRTYTYGTGGEKTENFGGADGCKECDVVVRPGAKLLSSSGTEEAKTQFRNMYVYQNGKLELNKDHTLQLEYLEMRAVNDTVSYAIVNNTGGSITTNKLVHVKRINDQYWYPFSLPYDCKVATIRQYNGKSLGEYGTKWVIKYYDGEARNDDPNPTISQGAGGSSSYWKVLPNGETLKANVGYIIGFDNADRITRYSVYFTPVAAEGYTESATADKSVSVQSFGNGASSDKQHWGWNNIGQPFISIFKGNVNTSSVLQPGEWGNGSGSTVYLSVPDGGSNRTYTQFDASTYAIEPFKAYFVQVKPNLTTPTLNFGYASRTLTKAVRAAGVAPVRLELNLTAADGRMDNAGVVVGDEFAAEYEIGDDLVKLYAQSTKPQLFSRNTEGYRLAYNALPTSAASCVPLGIYAPAAGQYTISLDGARSYYDDVEAVSLLCYGEIVADLLQTDYTFTVPVRGEISDYSLNIQRAARVTTPVNVTDEADAPYLLTDGHTLRVEQLPSNCRLQLTDAVGRVIETRACEGLTSCELTVPVAGVYMVLLTDGNQNFILRTIVK